MDKKVDVQNSYDDSITNNLRAVDEVSIIRDPLDFNLDEKEFIETANRLIAQSKEFYEKTYRLTARRKENEKYLFGRELDGVRLKDYNTRFADNIIYEAEAYIKPMVLSHLPDIVVKPGTDNPQSIESAKMLSKIVDTDIKSRERKRVLGLAFRHHPVYFLGCIKAFWNPEKGTNGDYDFKVVHPEYLVLDHKAMSNDTRDMDYVAEIVEYTVKEWVMRFPDKEKELYDELRKTSIFDAHKNENNEAGMNSKVKGWEFHYTWYDKKANNTYERIEAIAWFYNKLLLKNMKTPNWDWEGQQQYFSYTNPVSEDQLRANLATGAEIPGMQTQQIFHNHLEYPDKPYIFVGYDQWGKMPLDETTRIEQVLFLQQNENKRGRQITEMLDRSRGKHVFSSDQGMKKEDLEEMDFSDPEQDIFIKGKVNEVHSFIPGEVPSPAMVEDKRDLRERIFDKMGVHGPARGEVDTGTAATNNQLSREGDFTRVDDLADDTINYACEKMANWILQFIKLRYNEDHYKRIIGEDGKTLFHRINQDIIEDGMEVAISASGTDKLKAEQRAMDMAKLKLIDPLQFYIDTNSSDPKGRTEKLMTFLMQPDLYLQKYVLGQTTGSMANALTAGLGTQGGGSPQALQDIMQLQQGTIPPVPSQIDAQYVETFTNWMHSPEFEQLIASNPQLKQQIIQFAEQVSQLAQRMSQQPQQPAQPMPNGSPTSAVGVGPISNQPQPGNTQKIAIGTSSPSMVQ